MGGGLDFLRHMSTNLASAAPSETGGVLVAGLRAADGLRRADGQLDGPPRGQGQLAEQDQRWANTFLRRDHSTRDNLPS
jgi:hypothetical protein